MAHLCPVGKAAPSVAAKDEKGVSSSSSSLPGSPRTRRPVDGAGALPLTEEGEGDLPYEGFHGLEAQALVWIITVFLWPFMLAVAQALIKACSLARHSSTYASKAINRLQRRLGQRLDGRTACAWSRGAKHFKEVPNTGLHWFTYHNVCHKDEGKATSLELFDPSKPTVIYVHGYQPGVTARRFRESLNWQTNDSVYGLDIDAADQWLEAGWNVGVFYWTPYADEPALHDAEMKIWTNSGSAGMRYRQWCNRTQRVTFSSTSDAPCVSEQLVEALRERFAGSDAPYRLVGHSLGCQLVTHASSLLSKAAQHDPLVRLPNRIALLDPFFTSGTKSFLNRRTISDNVFAEAQALASEHHVVFEQYQTSILGTPAVRLRSITAYFTLDPPNIPWYKLRARHVSAPYLYFLSFGDSFNGGGHRPSSFHSDLEHLESRHWGTARATEDQLRRHMAHNFWWFECLEPLSYLETLNHALSFPF